MLTIEKLHDPAISLLIVFPIELKTYRTSENKEKVIWASVEVGRRTLLRTIAVGVKAVALGEGDLVRLQTQQW